MTQSEKQKQMLNDTAEEAEGNRLTGGQFESHLKFWKVLHSKIWYSGEVQVHSGKNSEEFSKVECGVQVKFK